MKKYIKYIIAYGSSLLIALVGIVYQANISNKAVIIVLSVLSLLPFPLLLVNILLTKGYVKRINNTKVADMQGYMLRHRSEAEKTSHVLLKKLQRIRHLATVYTLLLWIMSACSALVSGIIYSNISSLLVPCVFYTGTLFCVVYDRVLMPQRVTMNENAIILNQDEYPLVYSTARRAAKALGCNEDITIHLSLDCNAHIIDDDKKCYLQLGVILLNVISEEELYCICLHEFSHCAKKNKPTKREMQYSTMISSGKDLPTFMLWIENLFSFFDATYSFNHMIYQYATSVANETEADRDMARYGSSEVAASSLLKIYYGDRFLWENGVKNEITPYSEENPNQDYLKGHVERFKKAIEARHCDWDAMINNEILSNSATHPTLKMRFETLGIDSVKPIELDTSSDYHKEILDILALADKRLYTMVSKTYEQDRKECYLDPLNRVTEWKNNGMPLVAETYADMISDLKQIGKHEEAEALCDRAIKELDENSSPHAYFMKGCALIHRYEESGIDLIYHALETNSNYLEEGLDAIGCFYCMMGKEKELFEYRERAKELAQKEKDEYRETEFISKKDKLSREQLPDGMLEDILQYIRSVDEDIIQNVYLVRKTISDTFFTSAFIIHFYGGTDAQRGKIMHKIFCYLDTYPEDWQFSLFNYFDCANIKFDKIEGSLVYSKSEHNKK